SAIGGSRHRCGFWNSPGRRRPLPPSSVQSARDRQRRVSANGGLASSAGDPRARATPPVCQLTASAVPPDVQPCAYLPGSSQWFRPPPARWESTVLLPESNPATEGVCIVTGTRVRRQRIKFFDVASANHDVVGLERGKEARHNICYVTTPLLLPVAVQSGVTYIVFISALFVGQVAKLHWLHDAVDDHGRSKPRSQT